MPLFQEIAFNEDVPVIHACRKDRVVVIATRVPLRDMLPERWGWILTLGGKGEIVEHDDVEVLLDNIGRRYPKVYLATDMAGYIENWRCVRWEAGYSDGKAAILKENNFPDMKQFKEDLLCEITKKDQASQEEQAQALQEIRDLSGLLDRLDQKQTEQLELLMKAMKEVQEHVGKMKDILMPIDTDDGSTNVDDSIKKLSASAKTLSDWYITSGSSGNWLAKQKEREYTEPINKQGGGPAWECPQKSFCAA